MTGLSRRLSLALVVAGAFVVAGCRNPNSAQSRQDFMTAVQEDQLDTVRRWLTSGLDPNLPPGGDCSTPLAVASVEGRTAMMALLAQYGARLDEAAGPNGRTALGCVAALDDDTPEPVSQLLQLGVDVDATGSDGRTPLMLAAERGHLEMVGALLEGRADVRLSGPAGVTAVDLAQRNGHAEVVAALINAGATLSAPAASAKDEPPTGPGVLTLLTQAGTLSPGQTYDEARPMLESGEWIDTAHQSPSRSVETRRINGAVYRLVFERQGTGPFRLVRIEPQ